MSCIVVAVDLLAGSKADGLDSRVDDSGEIEERLSFLNTF